MIMINALDMRCKTHFHHWFLVRQKYGDERRKKRFTFTFNELHLLNIHTAEAIRKKRKGKKIIKTILSHL